MRRLHEDHPELREALNFYGGGGAETGRRWRQFLGLLTAAERLRDRAPITEAANAAFADLTSRFSEDAQER